MKNYEIGDLVRIRSDLECGEEYGCDKVVDNMIRYLGMSAKIDGFIDSPNGEEYSIDIDNNYWAWTPEMFE